MSDPALAPSNASAGSARAADAARPSSGDAPRAGGGDVLAAAKTSDARNVLATSGANDVIATSGANASEGSANASEGSVCAADAAARPSPGDAQRYSGAGDVLAAATTPGASDVLALRPAAPTTSDVDKPTLRDLKRREIALKQSQRDEYAKMASKLCALGATDAHATTLAKVKSLDEELARLRGGAGAPKALRASAPPPKASTAADKTSKTWRRGSRALDGVAGEEVTVGGAEGGSILKKYSATAAAASKAPEERGEGFIVAPTVDSIDASSAGIAPSSGAVGAAAPRSAAAILRKYSSSSAARSSSVAQPKTRTKPTFVTSRPRRPSDEAGEAAEDMLPLAKRAKKGG